MTMALAPPPPSHYAVLGVDEAASLDKIRKSHRQRATHTHPDKGGSDEQFQRLQVAYEALSDAGSRAAYDRDREREQRKHHLRNVGAARRKQEEQRLARAAAAERARFVAVQRQKFAQQEDFPGGPPAGARASMPNRGAGHAQRTSGGRADARGAQQPPPGDGAAKRRGSARSAGEPAGVYSGVTGMDGANMEGASVMFSDELYAGQPASQSAAPASSKTAEVRAAGGAGAGSPARVSCVSRVDAGKILQEGIRRWTAPHLAGS